MNIFHQQIRHTNSATDFEQVAYDANSNVTSLRKRSGQVVNLGYDNLNRLLSRSYPTSADNIGFSYDLLGRRTAANKTGWPVSYSWDNAGRLTDTTAGGKTLSYQVDAAGNRTRTTWPETTPFYVTTTYDALNRPTDIFENGTVSLANYHYDDLSRRTTVTLGNVPTRQSAPNRMLKPYCTLGFNRSRPAIACTNRYATIF
ncbi:MULTISPECIES: RHS repeat protein [Methylomonas]|uniref:YD repeat-containing protein n=1 Tax=Methylomonas koyamae TaxID=702114 RepID=A0A177NIX4_9GAMM|nr:RHS repeat protein [Methylomonas koyamae]OAI17792.1 hypothetical protein A1355_06840 [Methylomonas koyamae]